MGKRSSSNFTDLQWRAAIQSNYKFTKNATYWEISKRAVYRWYLTPSRKAKFSPDTLPCTVEMSQYKKFLEFWSLRLIPSTLGCIQKSDPGLALVSINVDKIPAMYRALTMHVLFAARLIILRKWKNNITPNISEAIKQFDLVSTYEQYLAYSTRKLYIIAQTT